MTSSAPVGGTWGQVLPLGMEKGRKEGLQLSRRGCWARGGAQTGGPCREGAGERAATDSSTPALTDPLITSLKLQSRLQAENTHPLSSPETILCPISSANIPWASVYKVPAKIKLELAPRPSPEMMLQKYKPRWFLWHFPIILKWGNHGSVGQYFLKS